MMQYRELGRTGLRVSEIGLGCEGLLANDCAQLLPLLNAAHRAGVNCIDLYAPHPQMRSLLGEALRGRRDQFVLQAHLCSIWKDGQYERTREIGEVQTAFTDLLTRLETDYVEIGMVHYVDSIEDWRTVADGPVMQYAQQLKAEGKIGCIGLSSHNPVAAAEAVKSGLIDVLMFSINPCYDLQPGSERIESLWEETSYEAPLVNMNPEREALYELCSRMGVGITVMKAFGGGDLLSEYSPAGRALTPLQCIHYALTRPAVACVFSGAHSLAELEAGLAYETASDADRDYAAAFAAFPKISWKGHCMYCGHCAPCPVGIEVGVLTKFLHLAKAQGSLPETVREHYGVLAHKAGECIACGDCESRCPFDVPVRENMRQAVEIFGS